MKKIVQTLFILLFGVFAINAQIIFQEDFEGVSLPMGWTIESNATDGGWVVGTPAQVSSQYFNITSNGSSRVIASNDDGCNCDKSNDLLISPAINLSGQTIAVASFDLFYGAQSFQGATESAAILVSSDGVNWDELDELHGHSSWDKHIISLNDYVGDSTVYVAFRYGDGGGWLYGIAIDNFSIEIPIELDAELVKLEGRSFGEENEPLPFKGIFFNNGGSAISELEVSYIINGGAPILENFTALDIEPFTYFELAPQTAWVPDAAGEYEVSMEITLVNGETDGNLNNNSGSFETEIFAKVIPPNRIDEFLLAPPVTTEINAPSGNLNKPTDLTFFPILGKDELWVVNQRNESSGGSTLTINGASTDTYGLLHRVDGNAWHFMSLPTAIDFSPENFNFATSPGVKDANHNGGTFTGPTLWSSDPDIYALPSGGNGSHLDMLHGSPFSMGIAHEVDNVFWVYDDWNKDIVRYDFASDHGPGNADHDDGIVRRYKNIGIDADGDVPSHMVLDKATGWLYFVDNGNDRVMRLDINSGSSGGNLPIINETLAEHSQVVNFTIETIIDQGLDRACGIEIMENRLLVSDYATGEIIVYDMENGFAEMGRIATADGPGITGITIGPDGSIWYVNRAQNNLSRMGPGEPNGTKEEIFSAQVRLSPNPTSGAMLIKLPELAGKGEINLQLNDLAGKQHLVLQGVSSNGQLDLSGLANGLYLLTIQTDEFSVTKKVVVKK